MNPSQRVRSAILAGLATLVPVLLAGGFAAACPAQTTPEDLARLRRDQEEVLRKAERMQELMGRLLQRYEREGRSKEVELLKEGIAHLDRSGLMRDVAGIRDDLAAQAFSEAVRKQREVVDNLERLLNILLERRSVENLDQQIAETERMARTARELERAQRELRDRTAAAARAEPSAAERAMLEALQQLQREQAAEARANLRQAGARRPFLEEALRSVEGLLQDQQRLEQRAATEMSGQPDPARERLFELGELTQRTRELMGQVRDQGWAERLQQDARALEQALQGGDAQQIQQARDRLQSRAANAPNRPATAQNPEPSRDREAEAAAEAVQKAGAGETEAERQRLQEAARAAAELGARREQESQQRNSQQAGQLQQDVQRTGEALAEGRPPAPDSPAEAAQKANSALQRATESQQKGDTDATERALAEALRNLDEARARLQRQNPDAPAEAGRMAAATERTARDLRNAPEAADAERQAAQALQQAEGALRQAADRLPQAGEQQAAREQAQQGLQQARQGLEQARQTLQQALAEAGQDRTGDMQQAAERQQQLQQQAAQLQQQMQQAAQQGGLTEQQQRAAGERMQQAQQAMQQAQQQLQQGQQAGAAGQQQQAAERLQQAQQALQQNRPQTPEQQQAVRDLAQEQQKLQEDIVQLAREAKERQNREAQQALDQAAQAAERARRAMEEGNPDEALQQQEQARDKLEEAAKALEEEKDRYEDLRQEELLFRMKDELTQLLDKQQPITRQTLELQASAEKDGLSRPARRQLNQFAEEEQGLAGRVEFMVKALAEEGNLVFKAVLQANQDDLTEISRRLAGRNPDPGPFTTLLQQDVERRTQDLLAALERERQRREQERQEQQQQQQQQQQQSENRLNQQQQRLVSLIADLQMLRQLELDTRRAAEDLGRLLALRGDEAISEAEGALLERLGHRHGDVTRLFLQIKAQMEEMLQQMQAGGEPPSGGNGGEEQPRRGGGR